MAEGLAQKWLDLNASGRTDIELVSAGLAAFPGSPASLQAVEVLAGSGVDISSHRARQVTPELLEQCDLILVMTGNHKQVLAEMCPSAAPGIFTLAEFSGGAGDISDPYGQPVEKYKQCAREISELVDRAFHKIFKQEEETKTERNFKKY